MKFGEKHRSKKKGARTDRRGSTLVEAAVVFPIILLSLLTVIYLFFCLYSQTESTTALHHELLDRGGDEIGTRQFELLDKNGHRNVQKRMQQKMKRSEIMIECEKGLCGVSLRAETSDTASARGILNRYFRRTYKEKIYMIDEEKLGRWKGAAGEIGNPEVR